MWSLHPPHRAVSTALYDSPSLVALGCIDRPNRDIGTDGGERWVCVGGGPGSVCGRSLPHYTPGLKEKWWHLHCLCWIRFSPACSSEQPCLIVHSALQPVYRSTKTKHSQWNLLSSITHRHKHQNFKDLLFPVVKLCFFGFFLTDTRRSERQLSQSDKDELSPRLWNQTSYCRRHFTICLEWNERTHDTEGPLFVISSRFASPPDETRYCSAVRDYAADTYGRFN